MILMPKEILALGGKTGDFIPRMPSPHSSLRLVVEIKILVKPLGLRTLTEIFNKDPVVIIWIIIKGVVKGTTLRGIVTLTGPITGHHHSELSMTALIGEISLLEVLIPVQIRASIIGVPRKGCDPPLIRLGCAQWPHM